MMSAVNRPFKLESLVDALVVDLDRLQDTIAVKGVVRPLTYTVRDVAFEFHIFPEFDGENVRFTTAKSGDTGASRVSIQLGSITDRQIRETTREPVSSDDVSIEQIDEIEPETRRALEKIGVRSGRDLERIQQRNVDLNDVNRQPLDFQNLAQMINKARRRNARLQPSVSNVTATRSGAISQLRVEGENLALSQSSGDFPAAVVGSFPARVISASDREILLEVADEALQSASPSVRVALDPYAVIQLELNRKKADET